MGPKSLTKGPNRTYHYISQALPQNDKEIHQCPCLCGKVNQIYETYKSNLTLILKNRF